MSWSEDELAEGDDVFTRTVVTDRFLDLVREYLGENRSHLALSDADAHVMIMKVICMGISHREATEGRCTEKERLERHQEYCRTGMLGNFLYDWPRLQLSVMKPPKREQ